MKNSRNKCRVEEVDGPLPGSDAVLPYNVVDVVPVDSFQTLGGETHRDDVWINI